MPARIQPVALEVFDSIVLVNSDLCYCERSVSSSSESSKVFNGTHVYGTGVISRRAGRWLAKFGPRLVVRQVG